MPDAPRIRRYGDPVLSSVARPVEAFDADLAALVDDMRRSMAAADGVGLAAPQIGVGLRVFVMDCPGSDGERVVATLVNPVLELERGRELDEGEEGCLSVPGVYHDLARPGWARVRGFDETGAPVTVEGDGLVARCLQHEYDHLDGVVYVDKLPRRARKRLLAEMTDPAWSDVADGVRVPE
ncbi:peptide deformylase [Motilibacter peucedani]|uniref:Peptide deformylase n=1 Tax=Motilibacter peucedani TaxID=598650 RepID=A0A420XU66_9ACTN|nr:peptide deformylase [Motilibacter peucedani]RKS80199.1 peptide deformylase [Motilibacter peucedani]